MQKQTAEEIYEVLEKVVVKEKIFEEQQTPLMSLEKQEKVLYDKIITLGMKEQKQINKLSDEALKLLDEREELMNKEQKSIIASKKEFKKIKALIKELEDPKVKKEADMLFDIMQKRYEAHDALYEDYMKSLSYDRELYQMFKVKDLSIDRLEDQVNKLNASYNEIFASNEEFNELTKKYNEQKTVFYKVAGFKIEK